MANCHVLLLFNIIEVLLQLSWWLQKCYILANKCSKCDENPLCCTFLWITCLYNMLNTSVERNAFLKRGWIFFSRFVVLWKCTVECCKFYGYSKSMLQNVLFVHPILFEVRASRRLRILVNAADFLIVPASHWPEWLKEIYPGSMFLE